MINKLTFKNLTIMKSIKELLIEKQTEKLIRKKYSLNDELKMARKSHDTEEFSTYNTYVEECITKAKTDIEKQFAERNEKMKNNHLAKTLANINNKNNSN